jgi:hypothetical protein
MPSFLPYTDPGLLAWSLNFSTRITATPTAFGLTAALASSYAGLHSAYAAALADCDPNTRSKALVIAKNQARANLKANARLLSNLVQGTASVTDAQKSELGLNVRKQPTPIPPPTQAPVLTVEKVSGWTLSIRLKTVQGGTRGRLAQTLGAAVFSYAGENPPTDISQWTQQGLVGKAMFDVVMSNELPPGTKVWLTAYWFNGSKESGPACPPVPTYIQYGGVGVAAEELKLAA